MSRWIIEPEIERLYIPDDPDKNWIDIKKKLDVGDQDDLKSRLMEVEQFTPTVVPASTGNRAQRRANGKGSIETPAPEPTVRARFKPSTAAILVIAIKDWSFRDSTGHKIDVTEDNIKRMDPWLAKWLSDELEQRNPLDRPMPASMETSYEDLVSEASQSPQSVT